MDGSSASSNPSSRKGRANLPLITCTDCKSRLVRALKATTEANYVRYFYICSSRKKDGSGCPFWYREDEYEDFLMDKGYLPASYQPVFKKVTPKVAGEESKGRHFAEQVVDDRMDTLIAYVRNIALLLKCLVAMCVLCLVANMYVILRLG